MYHLKFISEYKRAYKRMKKRGADLALLDEVVDRLRRGATLREECLPCFYIFQRKIARKSLTKMALCVIIYNDAESRNHPFLTLRRKWLLVAVI